MSPIAWARWRAWVLSLGLLISATFDIWLVDNYHRGGTETPKFVALGAFSLATALMLALGQGVGSAAAANRWRVAATLFSLFVWFRVALTPLVAPVFSSIPAGASWALVLLAWILGSWRAHHRVSGWLNRLWLPVLVAAFVFVLSPIVMTAARAPHVQWPYRLGSPGMPPVAAHTGSTAVIYLLLDETSASASGGIEAELRDSGLNVEAAAVDAVGDATAKVIPSMWTGTVFTSGRPCGLTAICSDTKILDFSRVSVNRPDVDVVGFFHPYCAMHGLRSCYRGEVGFLGFSPDRWWCAMQHRLTGLDTPECRHVRDARWNTMKTDMIRAMFQAPVWTEGGMLFAHLPLPHPPGDASQDSLAGQYASNLDQARLLIRTMLARLRGQGISRFTFVVFSDHPLRVAMWCKGGVYDAAECRGAEKYSDVRVPLIVATTGSLPSLTDIRRNDEVFNLLSR